MGNVLSATNACNQQLAYLGSDWLGAWSRTGWSGSVPDDVWFTSNGMERFQQENMPSDSRTSSSPKKGRTSSSQSHAVSPRQSLLRPSHRWPLLLHPSGGWHGAPPLIAPLLHLAARCVELSSKRAAGGAERERRPARWRAVCTSLASCVHAQCKLRARGRRNGSCGRTAATRKCGMELRANGGRAEWELRANDGADYELWGRRRRRLKRLGPRQMWSGINF